MLKGQMLKGLAQMCYSKQVQLYYITIITSNQQLTDFRAWESDININNPPPKEKL